MRTLLTVTTLLLAISLYAQTPDEGLDLGFQPKFDAALEDIADLEERLAAQRDQSTYERAHGWLTLPPTRLGYAFRWHQPNARNLSSQTYGGITFDTNVGISWLLSPKASLTVPRTLVWGANLLYSGSYDFRMDLRSGPVLSRLQNPQASLYLEGMGSRGTVTWNLTTGWAHESNGQFAENRGDFDKLADIDPLYEDQYFASMGWDYLFIRHTRYFRFDTLSLMPHFEIRHLYRQASWNPFLVDSLEDSANITGLGIKAPGIRAYDGLRLGTLFTTGPGYHVNLDLILPTLWALEAPLDLVNQTGVEVSVAFDKPLTWYVQAKWGTRAEPAYYFSHEFALGAGLAIQGLDFWPK